VFNLFKKEKEKEAPKPAVLMSDRIRRLHAKAYKVTSSIHLETVACMGSHVMMYVDTALGKRRFNLTSREASMYDLNNNLLFSIGIDEVCIDVDSLWREKSIVLGTSLDEDSPKYTMSYKEMDLALVELEGILESLEKIHGKHEQKHEEAMQLIGEV
jgi:hypothetical protein